MGIWSDGPPEQARAGVRAMVAAARHRGPDGSGIAEILLGDARLVLGHTRLSILDLSDGARQPMQDAESGSWLAFNGEIYNFRELRGELESFGEKITSSGDSEVLLKALVRWGEAALGKIEGMFAFAFWDARAGKLLLARDRVGMKPLYYSALQGRFAFASEVKVLERAGIGSLHVDHKGVDAFLTYGAVTGPGTIFQEIQELEPGHFLWVSARGEVAKSEYWSLGEGLRSGAARRENFEEAVARVKHSLESTVNAHLVSDVPVGVFLSGGVDSSLLALLASRYSNQPVTLLTVAFPEQEFSELPYARVLADGLPHHHEVVTLTAEGLRDLLPQALAAMDQPTLDGMNTYVISRAGASLGLKVLLSGIGGDELFGGYSTFKYVPRLLRYGAGVRPAARLLTKLNGRSAARWKKIADAGQLQDLADAYRLQRSVRWRKAEMGARSTPRRVVELANDFQKIAVLELEFYMRNQLLRDADVFSMANSVELRVPFLDTQLIKTALEISPNHHFTAGKGKRITWQILQELTGNKIPRRRKMGFTFPWQQWLSRDLKEEIQGTLREKGLYDAFEMDSTYGESLLDGLERDDRSQSWAEVWSLFVLLNWQGRRIRADYAVA